MAQYTLPDWARNINTRTHAGPGMQGSEFLDFPNWHQALNQFSGQYTGNGDSQGYQAADYEALQKWLQSTGQSVMESNDGGQSARWLQDANGNITAEPEIGTTGDRSFGTAALLAGGLLGGAAGGLWGGAGAGATGAMTAEQVAMLAANGLTDVQIAAMATAAGDTAMASSLTGAGMGGGGGGLLSAGADAAKEYAPAMNAAQAESAVGTPGYGASSAGPGGGAGGFDWSKAGTGLLEYAAKNPKVVGGLLGAIGGATGGGGGSSGGAEAYTGPMPNIQRGGWQPRVQAQSMALPTFGQGMKTTQGVQNSGLWRFNKGG